MAPLFIAVALLAAPLRHHDQALLERATAVEEAMSQHELEDVEPSPIRGKWPRGAASGFAAWRKQLRTIPGGNGQRLAARYAEEHPAPPLTGTFELEGAVYRLEGHAFRIEMYALEEEEYEDDNDEDEDEDEDEDDDDALVMRCVPGALSVWCVGATPSGPRPGPVTKMPEGTVAAAADGSGVLHLFVQPGLHMELTPCNKGGAALESAPAVSGGAAADGAMALDDL